MHRASIVIFLKIYAKFFLFLRSHFDLTSVTWHRAAAAAAAAAERP